MEMVEERELDGDEVLGSDMDAFLALVLLR